MTAQSIKDKIDKLERLYKKLSKNDSKDEIDIGISNQASKLESNKISNNESDKISNNESDKILDKD